MGTVYLQRTSHSEELTISLTLSACAGGVITVVSLCVCLFVTTLTVTPFVYGPKVRYHRLLYDDFLDFDSRIALKKLCSRDMVLFAYYKEP